VTDLLFWIEGTALATWTRESPSIWAYPTILTLHTAGLGVVVGLATVIDVRLLGRARRIPIAALRQLFPLIATAFIVNAVSGTLLLMADATTKVRQPVFLVKLTMIAAGLSTLWVARRLLASAERTGELGAPRARLVAATSLIVWAAAITAGRLMAYL
jgi:hypothetical protein